MNQGDLLARGIVNVECFMVGTTKWQRALFIDGTVLWYDTSAPNTPGTPTAPAGAVPCDTLKDSEPLIMCDNNAGVVTKFLRRYTYDAAGTVTVTDTTFDGVTAYAVSAEANVSLCSETVEELVQTDLITTATGTIPQGAVNYVILNLGVGGTGLDYSATWDLNGVTLPGIVTKRANSVNEDQNGLAAVPYDANGNTLLVSYTV